MKKIVLVGLVVIVTGCARENITELTPDNNHGATLLRDSSITNGYATLQTQNGTYIGAVKNGKANGFGKTTTNDGAVYEGEHTNGEFHGRGKLTLSNGSYFIGHMDHGKVGRGTMYFTDGRSAPIR